MLWMWIIVFLIIGEVAIYFIFASVNWILPYGTTGARDKYGWFFYFLCLSMFSMAGVSLLAYLDTYKRLDQMVVVGDRFLSVLKTTYSLKEMESNQRGYLLTDRGYYLKYYIEKKSLVTTRLEEMKKAYEGSPDRDRVQILYNLVQRRVVELGEAVALKKAGKSEETAQRLLIDEGADTTELITISGRDLLNQGVTEHRRMVNEVQALSSARVYLAAVLMVGAAVQVVLSAVVGRARREETGGTGEEVTAPIDLP